MTGGSLLIVEDEYIIALSQKQRLERHGFSVQLAYSGLQALDAVEAAFQDGRQFDAILMDINLGGGPDGIALTRTLQLMDPSLLILFLSSQPQSYLAQRAPDLLIFPFISKATSPSTLPGLVAQHILERSSDRL
ncbi:response regulator [Spirochaeta lutea]|uniref:Response regulatory domain-containing protein n=1 Tax=Spirochaeta lutea TaxID=1480694 RepID=A0A098R0H5_9SPIO|nr:response regulator [Spirochaeta lutea]KGE72222.1 hypothetical protein DC28_07520 [Spirochaeta lutea]